MRSRRRGGFFKNLLVRATDAMTHYAHNADRRSRARKPKVVKRKDVPENVLPIVNIPEVDMYDLAFFGKFIVVHRDITESDAVVVYFPHKYGGKERARNGRYVDVDDCTYDDSPLTSFPCKITLESYKYYGRPSRIPFTGFNKGYHFVLDSNGLSQHLVSIVEICAGKMHKREVAYKYPRLLTSTFYFENEKEYALASLPRSDRPRLMAMNQNYAPALKSLWEEFDFVDRNPDMVVVSENTPNVKSLLHKSSGNPTLGVVDIGGVTLGTPIHFTRHFIVATFDETKLKVVNPDARGFVFIVNFDVLADQLLPIFRYIVHEDDLEGQFTLFKYEVVQGNVEYEQVTV